MLHKSFFLILVVLTGCSTVAFATTRTSVITGNWTDPATWDTGVPVGAVKAKIVGNNIITVNSDVAAFGPNDEESFTIGNWDGTGGILNIEAGGNLVVNGGSCFGHDNSPYPSTADVNVSGGNFAVTYTMRLARYGNSTATISTGSIYAGAMQIAYEGGGIGHLQINGGKVRINGDLKMGPQGSIDIAGGQLLIYDPYNDIIDEASLYGYIYYISPGTITAYAGDGDQTTGGVLEFSRNPLENNMTIITARMVWVDTVDHNMFAGGVTRAKLEEILSKSLYMGPLAVGEGVAASQDSFNEGMNMVENLGQGLDPNMLIKGAAYSWDVFPSASDRNYADDEAFYAAAKNYADQAHARNLYLILEGGIFETAYAAYAPETPSRVAMGFSGAGVEQIPVPAWVFTAFGETPVTRNFNYEDMIYSNGLFRNRWLPGASVPDISRPETKKWFYYRACRFIDAGYEALDFAQIYLETYNDRPNYTNTKQVLDMIRAYAADHARRKWVFITAGTNSTKNGDNLLFDYHSWPLRIKGVEGSPHQGILEMGYADSIYGNSAGGISPSGWSCTHLPYIVTFDNNGGKDGDDHSINTTAPWIWNWDEIAWFAHQTERYRNDWLWYASTWVRTHDTNGYMTMTGRRICQDPVDFGIYGGYSWLYRANMYVPCNYGFNQEETIKAIWNSTCSGYSYANLNNDCTVNAADLAMFAQKWQNAANCDAHYAQDFQDFNGDCEVDLQDLALFVDVWLTSF